MRYGFHLPVDQSALHKTKSLVSEIARLGYTDVWTAEANGYDALTPLAVATAWEPGLRTGAAILSAYTRGPALLAMSAAAMADASPGGFSLGIGASSKPIVESWNAISYESPYARVRDTIRFLRRAMTGERIQEAFPTFTIDGFRLAHVPEQQPTLLIAALRPQMLRLAGREADGAILNWLSASDVTKSAGEVGPGRQLVVKILVCLEPDESVFFPLARRMVAAYLTVEAYAAHQVWLGREEALTPMWEAWSGGDRKAALEVIPDSVIEDLFVFGSTAECRNGIARYADAGATTTVVCNHPGGRAGSDVMRALAP